MNYKFIPSNQFEKDVKKLQKNIKKDLLALYNELMKNPLIGTSLGNNCYKIRVTNSSLNQGKSSGFRTITLVKIENDRDSISDLELKNIIETLNN